MAAGDLSGSVDAFALFAAGPRRSLGDVAPEVVGRVRDMARRTMSKHRAGEQDWSVPVRDTWERAARLAVPVLAVPGALDSPDHIEMAERLAGLVANGRTTVIEGAAHYPNMERPRAFQRAVTEFRSA
jgi:pimeloyl-ACP methyl ester carboxylesterase